MWILTCGLSVSAPASEVSTSLPAGCWGPALSVWWKGKPLPSRSWRRVWKTAPWTRRLLGRISPPSTVDPGLERWISSWRATPAPPSPAPASSVATRTSATSGPRSSESFARWDQALSCWRTSQGTFGWDSTASSLTLPTSGSMRNGALFARPMPGHRTAESGSSFWPTPVAGDAKSCGAAGYSTASGRHAGVTLTDAARIWAGPRDLEATGPGSPITSTLRLNPRFVEALMGFRAGWTACASLGTPSAPSRRSMQSDNS